MIDTTPLAAYLQGKPAARSLIGPWLRQREAATSILVYGEIVEHLKRLPTFAQQQHQLRLLLHQLYPSFLTYSIVER